jgi:hypothetical protein
MVLQYGSIVTIARYSLAGRDWRQDPLRGHTVWTNARSAPPAEAGLPQCPYFTGPRRTSRHVRTRTHTKHALVPGLTCTAARCSFWSSSMSRKISHVNSHVWLDDEWTSIVEEQIGRGGLCFAGRVVCVGWGLHTWAARGKCTVDRSGRPKKTQHVRVVHHATQACAPRPVMAERPWALPLAIAVSVGMDTHRGGTAKQKCKKSVLMAAGCGFSDFRDIRISIFMATVNDHISVSLLTVGRFCPTWLCLGC